MSVTVNVGDLSITVPAQRLSQAEFAPFGDVVGNPRPDLHPTTLASLAETQSQPELPYGGASANQGSAIRYRHISRPKNLYAQAPSGAGQLVMTMFVCGARRLETKAATATATETETAGSPLHGDFTVKVLERHPFTTQTFAPLCSRPATYLVIVCPSLAPSAADAELPVPTGDGLPGRGLPDLRGLKAFVATSSQAVTYGAGTWHAPMVVLGEPSTAIDFLVTQHSSGVPVEDCQLTYLTAGDSGEPNIKVDVSLKE